MAAAEGSGGGDMRGRENRERKKMRAMGRGRKTRVLKF